MAETETSKALSQETGKTTDLYSQNKLKLNFNDETGVWEQIYEPVKASKMFMPPAPKPAKPTDIITPTATTTTPTVTPTVTQPAVPLVQPRDGESLAQKQQRENMEAYGPGQDPMTFAKTMSSIFTPGTTQNRYYTSRQILKQDGDKLTVNFDMIDEKGGYGLPSVLGAAFRFAEKDIMEGSLNKMRYMGIIKGDEIKDAKGSYTFTVDQDAMNKYNQNASLIATKLQGGYLDTSQGKYIQKNYYLNDELRKLGNEGATKFISDLAISSADDNMKNIIDSAITSGDKGAAAALVAWQTKTDLDLDATGLFGTSKYNEGFKQGYTETFNKLVEAEKNIKPADTTTTQSTTTKGLYANTPEGKALLSEMDKFIKEGPKETNLVNIKSTPKPSSLEVRAERGDKTAQSILEKRQSGTSVPKAGTVSAPPGRTAPTTTKTSSTTSTSSTAKTGTGAGGPPGTRSGLVNRPSPTKTSTSTKTSTVNKRTGR